ncbi:hypothetical protein R5H57_002088 [Enterococcus faecium]|nr:hypothetical protein [Enterococcus faecium]
MTTEEVIQMRIRSIQREIDDLERTKAVMVNETARKAILLSTNQPFDYKTSNERL